MYLIYSKLRDKWDHSEKIKKKKIQKPFTIASNHLSVSLDTMERD